MFIDNLIINLMHNLCIIAGIFFNPFFRFISLLGEKGIIFVLLGFFLALRKKTRWVGGTIILSIFLGFIVADFVFKPFFERIRPYLSDNTLLYTYWQMAGGIEETGYSMPSGHTIAATACFVSLFITAKKTYRGLILKIGIVIVSLMVLSRCYQMHHYFTDCLAGIVIGTFLSFIAKIIIKAIYNLCKRFAGVPFFNFVLNFDIVEKIIGGEK